MKILVANNGYLRAGVSGGDKHLLDVGESLSREHEVTFILPDFVADLPAPGIRCRTYWAWPPRSILGIMLAYLLRGLRARSLAIQEPADVVLSSSGPFDILPAFANRRRWGSCVAVYPFHLAPRRKAPTFARYVQFGIARIAQRFTLRLMRHSDVVFTDNSIVKAELIACGIPAKRIHVQRPVVNVDQVRSADVCRRYQVMFIGRMVQSKGIYDLVDALKEVTVSAGLVGDGEELIALREYVKKCGLAERVHVLGKLPSSEMYALLKGCELFVFPSNEEGYGIAIAEAIAAGRPVLAYGLPHYGEAFNNSLITVPVGNVNMLAERMRDFFAKKIDIEAIRKKYRNVSLVSKDDAAAFELGIIRATIEEGSHELKE